MRYIIMLYSIMNNLQSKILISQTGRAQCLRYVNDAEHKR